jgi:hypothetical protein
MTNQQPGPPGTSTNDQRRSGADPNFRLLPGQGALMAEDRPLIAEIMTAHRCLPACLLLRSYAAKLAFSTRALGLQGDLRTSADRGSVPSCARASHSQRTPKIGTSVRTWTRPPTHPGRVLTTFAGPAPKCWELHSGAAQSDSGISPFPTASIQSTPSSEKSKPEGPTQQASESTDPPTCVISMTTSAATASPLFSTSHSRVEYGFSFGHHCSILITRVCRFGHYL